MTENKRLLLIALVLYLAGYPMARQAHLLVHAVGYSSDETGPVIAGHSIRAGDAGVPLLHPVATLATWGASLIYAPLTPFERIYWNIAQPTGSRLYIERPQEHSSPK